MPPDVPTPKPLKLEGNGKSVYADVRPDVDKDVATPKFPSDPFGKPGLIRALL